MAYVTAGEGVKLYYEETGQGFPIVFVHEFAGDHRSYEPQVRYFARRYRCITYNARGYPPSDVPNDEPAYSQERARDDIRSVLDGLGIDLAHIVGISMGGFGALHLGAKLGPSRTAGICAISPALFTSFTGSTLGAFDSYDDWVQNNVVGLPVLAQIPLRIDCGTGDHFYLATRQFVSQLKTPPAGSFSAGGHDMDYWRAQLPGELAWMAS